MSYPASGFDAGRYVIAFNGAVYNYRELRDELEARHGATFATDGDTEVVVAAYHHWGEQAVTRLRGMFAVVIYDTHRGMVWGARDPYGIKPLYYLVTDDGLYLASEKKALLPFYPGAANDAGSASAIDATRRSTREPVALPDAAVRAGARDAAPRHRSRRRRREFLLPARRYVRHPALLPAGVPPDRRPTIRRRSTGASATSCASSVHAHLRADVPVGAFLSSGIDSTAIVAFAREVYPEIPTFTVGLRRRGLLGDRHRRGLGPSPGRPPTADAGHRRPT